MKVLCTTSGKSAAAWNMMSGALAAFLDLRIGVNPAATAGKSFIPVLCAYFPGYIKLHVLKSLLIGILLYILI